MEGGVRRDAVACLDHELAPAAMLTRVQASWLYRGGVEGGVEWGGLERGGEGEGRWQKGVQKHCKRFELSWV